MRFVGLAIHRIVSFVLHLEHDGDDLVALFIEIAEDEIALGALDHFVVLLEIGMWEGGGAQTVELDLAVLLEAFAEHLRRELRFHVLNAEDLAFAIGDELILSSELFCQRCLMLGFDACECLLFANYLGTQFITLAFNCDAGVLQGRFLFLERKLGFG